MNKEAANWCKHGMSGQLATYLLALTVHFHVKKLMYAWLMCSLPIVSPRGSGR